jgi:preprotein translocase subunit SecE
VLGIPALLNRPAPQLLGVIGRWLRERSALLLLCSAQCVTKEITQRRRTGEMILAAWSLINIALAAGSISYTGKLGNEFGEQPITCRGLAQFGRATVSKTVGCGFESCTPCLFLLLKLISERSIDRPERDRRGNKIVSRTKSASKSGDQPNAVVRYFRETRGELRKVTWPTRQESQRLTAIVLGVTAVMSIFLGFLDFIFSHAIQTLVRFLVGA